jgi:hypothetical protein
MRQRRFCAGAGSLHDPRLPRIDALIEHLSRVSRASASLREPYGRPMSERQPFPFVAPVKPKIPALRSARHDAQLDAGTAGICQVVASRAGLAPRNRIRSKPTGLGFAIIPPALRYAECLISKPRLSHGSALGFGRRSILQPKHLWWSHGGPKGVQHRASERNTMRCDGMKLRLIFHRLASQSVVI